MAKYPPVIPLPLPDDDKSATGLLRAVATLDRSGRSGVAVDAYLALPVSSRLPIADEASDLLARHLKGVLSQLPSDAIEASEETLALHALEISVWALQRAIKHLLRSIGRGADHVLRELAPQLVATRAGLSSDVGGADATACVIRAHLLAAYALTMLKAHPDVDSLEASRNVFLWRPEDGAPPHRVERLLGVMRKWRYAILSAAIVESGVLDSMIARGKSRALKSVPSAERDEFWQEARAQVLEQLHGSCDLRALPRTRGRGGGRPRSPAWAVRCAPERVLRRRRASPAAQPFAEPQACKDVGNALDAVAAARDARDLQERRRIAAGLQARAKHPVDRALLDAFVEQGERPNFRELERSSAGRFKRSTLSYRWRRHVQPRLAGRFQNLLR